MCEHFHENAKCALSKRVEKQHNVSKGRLPGITPNMIIGCVNKCAPPQVISSEHPYPRPPVEKNNLSVLDQLVCPVRLDILIHCQWNFPVKPGLAPSASYTFIGYQLGTGSVHCPGCYSCEAMHIKPASNLVLLMLKDVLVHCTICIRDMSTYEHPDCTPSLTQSAAKLTHQKISVLRKVYFAEGTVKHT